MEHVISDHLFRHQYGKMVSILTRIFGLSHLETIEDAIQDTFAKAILTWRINPPENPEAWLTKAAKNRAIDLLRKIRADQTRIGLVSSGPSVILIDELFLPTEIEDSQLRMIFTACHPMLKPTDQIAFALKTISGFGTREIAAALLVKEETIKKRLARARATINSSQLSFEIPTGQELPKRLKRVLEVMYLAFNEGFHSNNKNHLIRQDLCGESMRLIQILLSRPEFRLGPVYALFALMCFHAARLSSKTDDTNEIIDLKNQDRSLWYRPLIILGNEAMTKAVADKALSSYHFEAAIAAEHLKSTSFHATDWTKILHWYQQLEILSPSPFNQLNQAIILLQLNRLKDAESMMSDLSPSSLEQRAYLYYGTLGEIHNASKRYLEAIEAIDTALTLVNNLAERNYLLEKRHQLETRFEKE